MPLSWNEIKSRAISFSKEWSGEQREDAEAQTFWNEFFEVFGVRRRLVASFEKKVQSVKGTFGFIDLLWSGKLLAEHKSFGKSLEKAALQAFDYIQALKNENRDDEAPRYVVVSDFAKIVLYDLEPDEGDPPVLSFPIKDLHKHVHAFAFIPGYKVHRSQKEDQANIKAAELMGRVHDALAASGYSGHALERFLVRILFCLFAEDTGIFDPNTFTDYLEQSTREDGDDLGPRLGQLFDVLDTPEPKRQKNLDELLASLRYVNGGLFEETLRVPTCNRSIRNAILSATRFDWSRISPAVFGSLFQSVMDPDARRRCGAHYTTEENIMKVIRPLFLDELRAEFEKVRSNKKKLQEFHKKLASLTFFDPACGCGNFLVLAYRELRLLEMDVLEVLFKGDQKFLAADFVSQVDVDQFYGIEIVEFPVRIAETALWLMDHQMNVLASERFGRYYVRLPLTKSAKIVHGNALRIGWDEVLPSKECSYILGNPPYVGKHYRTPEQSDDLRCVLPNFRNLGDVDYVTGWFVKAAEYIQNTPVRVGFVSTNSITQGEQVPLVWELLQDRFGVRIHFAYRTFVWSSEARGKAHVHCVIIGFGIGDLPTKRLYELEKTEGGEERITVSEAATISPYLLRNTKTLVRKRLTPLGDVPEIRCGNKPTDGGFYVFTNEERAEFLKEEPGAKHLFYRYTGAQEYINGNMRWCLWLEKVTPEELRLLPKVMERVRKVKQFRANSSAAPTRQAAETPARFFYQSQPSRDYILIPEVSSERRKYIPMGIVSSKIISANTNFVIPCNDLYLFGILTSAMHMAWVKTVGGKLKSDYRYSGSLIYNTFPWPEGVTDKKKADIVSTVKKIFEIRKSYSNSTLADLYDPLSMPPELAKAHRELDRAVERCYRTKVFGSDQERLEFLFDLYERMIAE